MVAHEEKEGIIKTTVSLSPPGDVIGQRTMLSMPEAVDYHVEHMDKMG